MRENTDVVQSSPFRDEEKAQRGKEPTASHHTSSSAVLLTWHRVVCGQALRSTVKTGKCMQQKEKVKGKEKF